jgi:hypothetical protein
MLDTTSLCTLRYLFQQFVQKTSDRLDAEKLTEENVLEVVGQAAGFEAPAAWFQALPRRHQADELPLHLEV